MNTIIRLKSMCLKSFFLIGLLFLFFAQNSFGQKNKKSLPLPPPAQSLPAQPKNTIRQKPQKNSKDTTKAVIHILNNDYGEFLQADGRSVQKLMFHVKLRYGSDTMYCDSAFLFSNENSVEAFGDVAVFQADGTTAFANYMRYTANNKKVLMRGSDLEDVELNDGKGNILWSQEIIYNLQTKKGNYTKSGTLQSGSTIVNSKIGTYNLKTKDARFKNNVEISSPDYHVVSEDLGYNTETKIVTFFSPSTITNESSILKTRSGTYNTLDSSAYFTKRAAIWHGDQFIEADTLDYNHKIGKSKAIGRVIALDTVQKSRLYAQEAIYYEQKDSLIAYRKPLLQSIRNKDTLYLKADTLIGAVLRDLVQKDTSAANKTMEETLESIRQQTFNPDSSNQKLSFKTIIDSFLMNIFPAQKTEVKDSVRQKTNTDTLQKAQHIKNDVFLNQKKGVGEHVPKDLAIPPAKPTTQDNRDSLIKKKTSDSSGIKHKKTPLVKANADTVKGENPELESLKSVYNNPGKSQDTSKPHYFIGYHHVRIYSDSLQGSCDSLYYSQPDSLIKMFEKPILWPNLDQITGAVILLKLDSSSLKNIVVPDKGILVSRSGPEEAKVFNQVQGDSIIGFFEKNKLKQLFAVPNAESIYFVTNDDDEYVGCSQASSRQIEIVMDTSGHLDKIYYRQDVKQTMTPIRDVDPEAKHLERFQWLEALRPKDLDSFLKDTTHPMEPEWKE